MKNHDEQTLEMKQFATENIQHAGNYYYVKYVDGETLSLIQRIKAKCAECSNFYIDGKVDCEITRCPLYGIEFKNLL